MRLIADAKAVNGAQGRAVKLIVRRMIKRRYVVSEVGGVGVGRV